MRFSAVIVDCRFRFARSRRLMSLQMSATMASDSSALDRMRPTLPSSSAIAARASAMSRAARAPASACACTAREISSSRLAICSVTSLMKGSRRGMDRSLGNWAFR